MKAVVHKEITRDMSVASTDGKSICTNPCTRITCNPMRMSAAQIPRTPLPTATSFLFCFQVGCPRKLAGSHTPGSHTSYCTFLYLPVLLPPWDPAFLRRWTWEPKAEKGKTVSRFPLPTSEVRNVWESATAQWEYLGGNGSCTNQLYSAASAPDQRGFP